MMSVRAILEITNRILGITRALLTYRLAQLLCFPFIVFYFIARLTTERAYWPHFGERLGFLPRMLTRTEPGAIWLHAVSVGEIASAVPLIRELRSSNPRVLIYVSTSTVAGRRAAQGQIGDLVDGIFYAPIDYVCCVRRVLRAIRPALVIIFETEIWPNLYAESKRAGAGLAIVNGRISDRTWPRYLRLKWLFGRFLSLADTIYPQSEMDLRRYTELGVPVEKLGEPGNLKYDASLSPVWMELPTFGAQQIWIAASTVGPNERGSIERHETDEDEIVIRSFQTLACQFPGLLLILAPRQPARFEIVGAKLKDSGVPFIRRTVQRDDPEKVLALPGVLLLDNIGELPRIYRLADVAFVGGSIAPRGGHNILEPAAAGVPVIVGPHMQNFQAIVREFLEASAVIQIQRAEELTRAVRRLLLDYDFASKMGVRGRALVAGKRGAAHRISRHLWPVYYGANPSQPVPLASRLVLGVLASIWSAGGRLKRGRGESRANSVAPLSVPVISIGGITIGGSGKTPFTKYLAEKLKNLGYAPAILTRGYRRRSPAENLVFAPGAKVPSAYTGDEAQIFLRAGVAPIGIGANRYETARFLVSKYPETNVLLLDDGFQHARLGRDVDLVVIDGLDPFGNEHPIPLGRLREPLDALGRADIFVVTRAGDDQRFVAIRSRLNRFNPAAPVFRTRLTSRGWHDNTSGMRIDDLGTQRVAAFCGLGNPQNFWSTLEMLGLEIVFRWAFRDHHQYKATDIRRLAHQARAHGADMLVTTEKDRVNLPANLNAALGEINLAWLEIELDLEDEGGFFSALDLVLERKRVLRAGRQSTGTSVCKNSRFVSE